MLDYLIIIEILAKVINGSNLGVVFADLAETKGINTARVKDISYGVLRNYFSLNCIIAKLAMKMPDNIKIRVLLLIAVYELKHSLKKPYAVVNDVVNLAYKISANTKLKNFVNALLRNYQRQMQDIEADLQDNDEYRLNFPLWMIDELKRDYAEKYVDIIADLNLKPKLGIRVNPLKINLNEYAALLDKALISYQIINGSIVITDNLKIGEIPGFDSGMASVQDINAQKLAQLISPKDGDYILDACAAPGGKACQLLERFKANMTLLEIDKGRIKQVQENFTRLNLNAKLISADASNLDWWDGVYFDFIIADVPCSASGTIKRNPDIKINRKNSDIAKFIKLQQKIVINLWQVLKPGGYLVYITCSVFKRENQHNREFFQSNLHEVKLINELSLLPDKYGDGFYYCVLKKG